MLVKPESSFTAQAMEAVNLVTTCNKQQPELLISQQACAHERKQDEFLTEQLVSCRIAEQMPEQILVVRDWVWGFCCCSGLCSLHMKCPAHYDQGAMQRHYD